LALFFREKNGNILTAMQDGNDMYDFAFPVEPVEDQMIADDKGAIHEGVDAARKWNVD
jgi:hypothetical protein